MILFSETDLEITGACLIRSLGDDVDTLHLQWSHNL